MVRNGPTRHHIPGGIANTRTIVRALGTEGEGIPDRGARTPFRLGALRAIRSLVAAATAAACIVGTCVSATAAEPPAPDATQASAYSAFARISVRWNAVTATPAVQHYLVQYQTRAWNAATGDSWSAWTAVSGQVASTGGQHRTWHESLDPDLRYRYQIRAVNADGDGAWSATFPSAGVRPRPGPVQLDVSATATQVTLTWAMGAAGVTSWEYEQSTDGRVWGSWTAISPSGAATTSYVVPGLTGGTNYWFRVRAVNGAGSGARSNTVTATPGTVNRVAFEAATYTATEGGAAATVAVTMNPAATASMTIPITITPQGAAAATDYTVSGLTAGALAFARGDSRKTFTVTAAEDTDSDDETVVLGFGVAASMVNPPRTATVTLVDDDLPPRKPAASEVSVRAGWTRLWVNWDVPEQSITGLQFQSRAWDATGAWPTDGWTRFPVTALGTRIAHTPLDPDVRYRYRAAGYADGRTGPHSDPFPTAGVLPKPNRPTFTARQGATSDQAILSWSAGAASTTKWTYRRSADGGETWTYWTDIPGGEPTRSHTISGLTKGNHVFQMAAHNESGDGRPSAIVPVTLGARLTVTFGAASYAATEGGVATTVTVTMNPAADRQVRVPITATPQAGTAAEDYSVTGLGGGALNFNVADTSASFTIRANQDLDSTHDNLALAFGSLPAEVSAGAIGSATFTLTDDEPVPPQVTQGLNAVAHPGKMTVGWTGVTATPSVVGYELQYQRRAWGAAAWPTAWTAIYTPAPTNANTYSFEHDNLDPEVLYRYRVRAENDYGGASWSSPIPAAAGRYPAPLKPTVTATPAPGSMGLSWPQGPRSVTRWEVRKGTGSPTVSWEGWTAINPSDAGTVAHTVGSLANRTEYAFQVRAVNPGGTGAASQTVRATPQQRLTATFGAASLDLTEGASGTLQVTMTPAADREVKLPIVVTRGGGTVAADYTITELNSDGQLVFASGATSAAITVRANEDADPADETVTVAFGTQLPVLVAAGTRSSTQVEIDDNDTLTATVARNAATVAEDSDAVFTVTLAGATSSAPVTVSYETGGTATSGSDYTAPTGSLTIAAGVATGTITVATEAESPALLDPNETLSVTLTGVTGGGGAAVLGTAAKATTTITDPGAVTVVVAPAAVTVDEGRPASFTVRLSGAVSAPVTVKWKTTGVSATSGTDYTAQAATALTFAAGGTTAQTITVQTALDRLVEGDETFQVNLEADSANPLPNQVTLGTAATVTITDDDTVEVSVATVTSTVPEGTEATFRIFVVGGTSTAAVTVSYTVGGTATSADYTAPSGTLTIPAGAGSGDVTVATLTDSVLDPGETLSVTLTRVTGGGGAASLGAGTSAETTLTDAGSVTVSLDPTSRSVEEGSPASFEAVLSGTVASDVVVSWKTADGTAGSADYTAQAATSLTIAAGETRSSAFTVATTADTLSEASETFEVQIAADGVTPLPANVTISPTANTATTTITDDASDALTATVSRAGATVAEGSNAVFTVTLSGGTSTAPVTVRYETTGSATSGSDYAAPSGSLTIASGLATGTVTIATTADTVLDRGETLGLRLTGVSGGGGASSLGSTTSAATTITDAGTAAVGWSATSRSVDEGREATLTLSLSGAVSAPVTVKWKTTGVSATSGTDYTAQALTAVTIAAGSTTASLTVQTSADTLAEGSETFTVSLEADTDNPLPSGVSLGTTSATVTIDDDEALLVNISADSVSVVEGGSAAYTVRVTGGTSTAPVVVSYTVGGTATSADYTAPTYSLTVASGGASAALAIATLTDTVIDPDETLRVTLSGASTAKGSVAVGTPFAASLALAEPAGSSVTVSLDPTSRSVEEGSPASFEAVLSGTVASDVVVSWKTADGTAGSADYTAQSATSLTIAAGETRSSAFTVATTADTLSEASETFEVQIAADGVTPLPSNVTISPTANTSTTTITDDAADALTATVSRAGATVAEGSNAVFTVTLSGGTSTAPVTVRYETTGSATSGSDYAAPSGSLTIASGLATGTVTIATTADTVLDRGETLGLRLTGVSGGGGASSLGSTTSAATTITDAGTAAVGWSATSRSVDEGREATLTLSLSGAVSAPVTVKWKTTGVSATSGTDYTAQALTAVTIAAGSTTASLTVQTSADTLAEGSETFTVSLEADTDNPLPSGVSLGTTSATVTIDDDEALLVNISADSVSVVEGGSAAYTVQVTGGTSTAPVVVSYTVGGTATSADYTAPSGSLTVASGQATAAITIATTADTVLDPDETLRVTLSGASTT